MNLIFIFLFGSLLTMTQCAKILLLLPMAARSHMNIFRPLAKELITRGHQVTMVCPFKDPKPVENLKEITVDANRKNMDELTETMLKKMIDNEKSFTPIFQVSHVSRLNAENFFNDTSVRSLLEKGIQFDLAIVHMFVNEAALMAAYLVAKHVAVLSPIDLIIPTPSSPPMPLAYNPLPFLKFSADMNFFQRVINTVISTIIWILNKYMVYGPIESICQKYNPNIPNMEEAKQKICLSLVYADPVTTPARPGMPNVISIGNMHCKPSKPLSKEFSDFIDSSGDEGFILFSLGSVMQGKFLSKKMRNEFLTAFSRLKQKVIWKFEENLEDLPSNVMVTPWAPQQDILGHPKIRLFITHGGFLSTLESIYHGVPIIGLPLFGDQPANVEKLVKLGVGESLSISNITADNIYEKTRKILDDSNYKIKAKHFSSIARDEAVTSMERAIYWIEYVLRHDGADHLRSSAESVNYIGYFCLDVLTVLTQALVVLPLFITIKLNTLWKSRYTKKIKNKIM